MIGIRYTPITSTDCDEESVVLHSIYTKWNDKDELVWIFFEDERKQCFALCPLEDVIEIFRVPD